MKAADLDLRDLLHFEPKGGVLTFAGQRALLFDAVALGLLRRELVKSLGLSGARVTRGGRRSIASRGVRILPEPLDQALDEGLIHRRPGRTPARNALREPPIRPPDG